MKQQVIIVAPSLNPEDNVSGISSVTRYIIRHSHDYEYLHFCLGRRDGETNNFARLFDIIGKLFKWIIILKNNKKSIIHYNFSLETKSIVRDIFFINIARIFRHKIVLHLHGGKYLNQKCQNGFLKRNINQILAKKEPVIVLGSREKDLVRQRYADKNNIFELPNPVELPEADICSAKFVNTLAIHFLYLGRIEVNKGIGEIYSAFDNFYKEERPFVLHFAGREQGDNHYIEQFSNRFGDNFVYEGVVSGIDKENLLKKCQVLLLPSYYEGLPMSLLEAMGYGLIPIVTNVGSISEYVTNRQNGLFIRVKDANDLQRAIRELMDNKLLCETLSINSRKRIEQSCSEGEYINKLNDIYESIDE